MSQRIPVPRAVRVAVEPGGDITDSTALPSEDPASARRRRVVEAAVLDAGAVPSPVAEADVLIWLAVDDPIPLRRCLAENKTVEWVQLPWAGVEKFAAAGLFDLPVVFTCAKGQFAEQVGEHALAQILACLRHFVPQARIRSWKQYPPVSLHHKTVTILGGGGTALTLVRLLRPFDCSIRVLRRSSEPIAGTRTMPADALPEVLPDTDVLVLALALTPDTQGIIGARELALLPPHAIVVNVARGQHIDTDALVQALGAGSIAAAALDVTDPEPLPDGHPLWDMDNALITSHCADSFDYVTEQLAGLVRENIRRFGGGESLLGVVDPVLGY